MCKFYLSVSCLFYTSIRAFYPDKPKGKCWWIEIAPYVKCSSCIVAYFLPTHRIWLSPSVPLLPSEAHHTLFLLMQNKPIYCSVTASGWMIATQHLIYGYVPVCTCIVDILHLRQISPVFFTYISALLYITSFIFLLHIV